MEPCPVCGAAALRRTFSAEELAEAARALTRPEELAELKRIRQTIFAEAPRKPDEPLQ
jgi:hypothetical protein